MWPQIFFGIIEQASRNKGLKKNDVQPLLNDQTYIIITGKGKKERIILFSEKAILAQQLMRADRDQAEKLY